MKYYIDDINYQIRNNPQKFVNFCEEQYTDQIVQVAQDIIEHSKDVPVVLLSGPSGSGKTTTALLLERYLDSHGHETHVISLDNYFRDLSDEEIEISRQGGLDLESPSRLDSDYLNMQIEKLLKCETIPVPRYNFVTAKREFSGWNLKRKEGEIIIFEGTHALNPDVITVSDENTAKLYVSIRSCYTLDDDELRSKVIRLGRRMLRDTQTRDRNPEETLSMFNSVNIGEDKYIKPFMNRCTYSIDTLIPYEINIYKTLLYKNLENVTQTEAVKALTHFLDNTESLCTDIVPHSSLIREFIGDSELKY